jgi:threonine dehydrogenase-like Zn-dependent dehydrogenase
VSSAATRRRVRGTGRSRPTAARPHRARCHRRRIETSGELGQLVASFVGPEASPHLSPGDHVVIPFNISCGHCWMCQRQLYAQCETTQNRAQGKGASLFGYTKLYGHVPGGQAEYLRVSQPQFGPIKVPEGPPDDRFVYLSGILPTRGWRADRVHGGLLLS